MSETAEHPTPVSDAAMDVMRHRLSTVPTAPPAKFDVLYEGQWLRLIKGPLEGREAFCIRPKLQSGTVRVMLRDNPQEIEVSRETVAAA